MENKQKIKIIINLAFIILSILSFIFVVFWVWLNMLFNESTNYEVLVSNTNTIVTTILAILIIFWVPMLLSYIKLRLYKYFKIEYWGTFLMVNFALALLVIPILTLVIFGIFKNLFS
jgi:hypothetical protein